MVMGSPGCWQGVWGEDQEAPREWDAWARSQGTGRWEGSHVERRGPEGRSGGDTRPPDKHCRNPVRKVRKGWAVNK